ncbi:PARP-domain-containing protein [Mycena albidolilacea]|uniref:Poly [ADP-ribose] polymerase n=1 Tax=Mycena albidolilacea TaxID=1033008 RepID=A0AAD6ZZ35_9AGAR|nr:PARP-domain-containing protein [Mycena albidolilacea]
MFLRRVNYPWRHIIQTRGFSFTRICNGSKPTVPVDPTSCQQHTHRVHTTTEPWDAVLNQTDISGNQNKNKFYIMQLLRSFANPDSYALYTRWGRVGELGRSSLDNTSAAQGERMFSKKFKSKTGVEWAERETVTPQPGKYIWLDRHYEDDKAGSQAAVIPQSTLAPEVLTLCNFIFSKDLFDAHLASMNYNEAKIPLGKLGRSTISKGFSALKSIADVIDNPNGLTAQEHGGAEEAYATLSSTYYSIIPHVSGRSALPVINDAAKLKQELDLMDSLLDMEVASKIMSGGGSGTDTNSHPVHPMDAKFTSLMLSHIAPVDPTGQEHAAIAAYTRDTELRASTFALDVQTVFRVEREVETQAWTAAGHDQLHDDERLLLWHGSRSTNFAGILKNGLRIAPPEAPSSGYMFGRGVYFADMVSKSFNYCHSATSNDTGLLLLCEVAARPFFEQAYGNYNADVESFKAGKRSTKGLGRSAPAHWTDSGVALGNDALRGCMMPGGPRRLRTNQPALHHNEYIVYNLNQIRLRYVVMLKAIPKAYLT